MSAASLRPTPRAVAALGLAAVGAAAGTYAWARLGETRRFTLREVELVLPSLPADMSPVRLLHISDIHLMPSNRRKLAFLGSLARLEPDLVVDTGDNISSPASIAPLTEALAPLLSVPGAFVMGSNDMYAPSPKNPLRYFLPDPRPAGLTTDRPLPDMPTRRLGARLAAGGWADLTNARATSRLPRLEVRWVGVDDPHLELDEMPPPGPVQAPEDGVTVLRIGVAHAPYRRVLDRFAADGCDLILAGHTHGGQLRIPGLGALVTNCDLPRAQARGLSTWRGVPLHVSGGMGASPYSDYRFANPPEATLLTLRPGRR